jgi:hypothetical protein
LSSAALGAVVIAIGACAGAQDKPPVALPVSPLEARPAPVEPAPPAGAPASPGPGSAEAPAGPIAAAYGDAAARILAAATADQRAYEKLAYLTDRIGHRLSGSAGLAQAVAWAAQVMRAEGHENVRTQKVMVPHWVRGQESAAIVTPVARPMAILGLGNSVGTGPKGVTAEVVVVKDFDALDALGAQVAGKIVLYDKRMPPYTKEGGSGYGDASPYRVNGASRAAKLGARAVLVRSLTAHSLRTPHTGMVRYEDKVPQIPAAAISVEDAELIARLAAAGETVKVRLTMGARMLPDAESANVIAELVGREKPEEIVVIGGHLDSWDVGQGAHDDGAGCVMMMHALTLLRELGLRPRRTIRVVLFTNEENGLRGAIAYAEGHAAGLPDHVMALESDSGGFAPRGIGVEGNEQAVAQVRDLIRLLAPLGATEVSEGHSGADLIPLVRAGVPSLGFMVEGARYFDYHHTDADTLDKVVPEDLARSVAAVATVAYVIADMPERFGQAPAEPAGAAPAAAP